MVVARPPHYFSLVFQFSAFRKRRKKKKKEKRKERKMQMT